MWLFQCSRIDKKVATKKRVENALLLQAAYKVDFVKIYIN